MEDLPKRFVDPVGRSSGEPVPPDAYLVRLDPVYADVAPAALSVERRAVERVAEAEP